MTPAPRADGAWEEWRTGWPLVLASFVGFIGAGAQIYVLSVTLGPLTAAHHWPRAVAAAPMTIYAVGVLALAAPIGTLVDRVGPRRVALAGAPLAGLAFSLVGLSGAAIWTWMLAWTGFAAVALSIGPLVWCPALVRHFRSTRGLALGVAMSGSGLAGFIWPPISLWCMQHGGTAGAFEAVGGVIGVVGGLVVGLLFRGPATGPAPASAPAPLPAAPHPTGSGLAAVLRTPLFWRISLVLMLVSGVVSGVMVHVSAFATDRGFSAVQAARVLAIFGPALIVGRLAVGLLLDRVPGRAVVVALLVVAFAACVLLATFDGRPTTLWAAAVLIGLANGAETDLLGFLLARHFGSGNFGSVYGAGLSIFSLGYGLAPAMVGASFDYAGSYVPACLVACAALAACAPLALGLPGSQAGRRGGVPGAAEGSAGGPRG